MAQTGFTPIQLYYSTTATNVPAAVDLVDGELALNIADMKLYAKDSTGTVVLLASTGGATGTVSSVNVSGGTTGLTFSGGPITTTGVITMAGTLDSDNGGTGQNTYAAGDTLYYAAGVSLSKLSIGATDRIMTSSGTAPQWTDPATITVGFATAAGSAPTTNPLTMNDSGTGAASGTTFDGSVARTISYNTIGAPKADGTGASGTWGINISGNAATATAATNLAGGALDRIPYQTAPGTTAFIAAPTAPGRFLYWDNFGGFQWLAGTGLGTVTAVDVSGGTTGLTFTGGPITTAGTITMSGVLDVDSGGTGLVTIPTNGQIDIGNGTGFTRTTLTAGSGINITNGAGSITIETVNNITNGKLYFFSAF